MSRHTPIRSTLAGVFAAVFGSIDYALRAAAAVQDAAQDDAPRVASRRRRATGDTQRSKARGSTAARSARQRPLPADVARALQLLGLPARALPSPDELRRARNAAILTAHPDRGGSNAAAARVIEAYRIVAGAIPQS